MKFKSAVWLLCLLLFIAAVDTIPDPPAINPSGGCGDKIASLHVRGPITFFDKAWLIACNLLRRGQMPRPSLGLLVDEKPIPFSLLTQIHYATDSSPPPFS